MDDTLQIYFSFCVSLLRGNIIKTERLPGMHPFLTLEWAETGPGGEGKGHVWSPARMPRPLQQLWQHLPQWGQVCGEAQRILVRLHQFSIRRAILQKRYNRHFHLPMCRVVVNTGYGQVIESHDLTVLRWPSFCLGFSIFWDCISPQHNYRCSLSLSVDAGSAILLNG